MPDPRDSKRILREEFDDFQEYKSFKADCIVDGTYFDSGKIPGGWFVEYYED